MPAPLPCLPPPRLTGVLPVVLYLAYMSLLVWCLFLAMGTIGFLSSFLFTYAIFNAAKSVSGGGCLAPCWEGGRGGPARAGTLLSCWAGWPTATVPLNFSCCPCLLQD